MYYTPPFFYPAHLQHSSCKHAFSIKVQNSADPDQMASFTKPSDLDPHCFQNSINPGAALQADIFNFLGSFKKPIEA